MVYKKTKVHSLDVPACTNVTHSIKEIASNAMGPRTESAIYYHSSFSIFCKRKERKSMIALFVIVLFVLSFRAIIFVERIEFAMYFSVQLKMNCESSKAILLDQV